MAERGVERQAAVSVAGAVMTQRMRYGGFC